MKVLLVEDERLIMEGVKVIVESLGADFAIAGCANNGLEAISMLENETPDIVVTDVRMPGMDGLELLHHIQSFHPGIVSIVLSGYDDYPFMRKALQGDAVDYLLKPVQQEELEAALYRAADRKRAWLARSAPNEQMSYQFNRLLHYVHEKWFDQWIHGEQPALDERFYGDLRLSDIVDLRVGIVYADFRSRPDIKGDDRLAGLAAYQIMAESVQSETSVQCFRSRYDEMLFIAGQAGEEHAGWQEGPDRIKRNLEQHLQVPVFLCISSVVPDVAHLAGAYEEIRRLAYARCLDPSQTVVADRLDGQEAGPDFREAADCLGRGQIQEGMSRILRMSSRIREQARSEEERLSRLNRLCLSLWHAAGSKLQPAVSSEALFNAFRASDEDGLESGLRKWAEEAGLRDVSARNVRHALVEKAQRYMDERYRDNITLSFLADYVHLNAAYFSVLFKQETGVNFIDYLNHVRIAASKLLLRDYSMKIYEVADKVGYGSVQHFMKTFRTLEGTTPSEYRQALGRQSGPS